MWYSFVFTTDVDLILTCWKTYLWVLALSHDFMCFPVFWSIVSQYTHTYNWLSLFWYSFAFFLEMFVFMDRRFWCLLLFTYFLLTLSNLEKKILAWLTYINFTSSTAGTKHTFAAGGNTRKPFLKINNTFHVMNCTDWKMDASGMQQVEIYKF